MTASTRLRLPKAPRTIEKGSTLTTLLDRDAVECLAHNVSVVFPAFDAKGFNAAGMRGIAPLGILQRGKHLAEALRPFLPARYEEAAEVLLRSLTPPLEKTNDLGLGVFFYLPHVCFVSQFGLDKRHNGGRDPFEAAIRVSAFREFPSRERNSWMLFLTYSNNSSFLNNIPIPGAAYVFREPLPGLQATVGLPFVSLSYQPGNDWRTSLSVFGPTNISLEASRRLPSKSWAYVRFERNPSQWLRADRAEHSDRLIFDHQEARVGIRSGPVWNGVSLDVSAGRDFRRRFFESRDASRSSVPKAELADAWIGSLRLSWRR